MTTNQTIDGVLVPRELAKRLAVPMLRTPKYLLDHRDALDELRALLEADQPAPVAVTLNQVLTAYDYADSHPHKYLRGTTNWCAAVAHKLNACLDEVTRLNTKE